jgi:hypothetical protein
MSKAILSFFYIIFLFQLKSDGHGKDDAPRPTIDDHRLIHPLAHGIDR